MSQRQAKEENAFLTKLSVLSNNGERIEEQVKQICKAADQIDKYIQMLRETGLTIQPIQWLVILQRSSYLNRSYYRL
jgi:hypothetical protein